MVIYYLLNCDSDGMDSLGSYVNDPQLKIFKIPTYPEFDKVVKELKNKVSDKDTVIVDTISMLSRMFRTNIKIGTDPNADYWVGRMAYYGEKNNYQHYEAATNIILQRIKDLFNVGAKIIATVHEKEKEYVIEGFPVSRYGFDLNDDFIGGLMGSSSDVFRFTFLREPVMKGEVVKYPKGTRVLLLEESDRYISKYRVSPDHRSKVPAKLYNPTYPKLCKALNKTPSWLTVYGSPGVGKTTFAVSSLFTQDTKEE